MLIPLALLTVLTHGLVSVPHSYWRAIDVPIEQAGTEIECRFEVRSDTSRVNATLLTIADAERFSHGRGFTPLASTGFEFKGSLRYTAEQPGKYVLILDNRVEGRRPTEVELQIDLEPPRVVVVKTVPVERRRAVVLISVLSFLGVVAYAARKLSK